MSEQPRDDDGIVRAIKKVDKADERSSHGLALAIIFALVIVATLVAGVIWGIPSSK